MIGYLLALSVVALNRFPVIEEFTLALRRVFVIGMLASMGAIIVDSFDKDSYRYRYVD